MIMSALYLLCFLVMVFNSDIRVRIMSIFGIVHILCENTLLWWFTKNIQYFDWTLYLTSCWLLDICLLFASACVLRGWRKKLTLSVCLPLLFCQMVSLQYPFIFPAIFGFAVDSSYPSMMEMIILCSSLKDTTIREWIKTCCILSCLVIARFIPTIMH